MNATLFIPDISGFTHFVKHTEQVHSRHIIRELLELIIEKGKRSFKVAEIEGDAVFFYHEGLTYPAADLTNIVRSTYQAFHDHLSQYESKRICDCGACRSANDLSLKFVVHSGDIELLHVADTSKPFGEPVIAVHRLLKNDIPLREYILYSCVYLNNQNFDVPHAGTMQYSDLGKLEYKYQDISTWWEKPSVEDRVIHDMAVDLVVRKTRQIDLPADDLHTMLVNLKYRHLWMQDADEVIYDQDEINQVGTQHHCIIQGKDLHFDTVRPGNANEFLNYGEVLRNPDPFKYFETDYFLREEERGKTQLTMVIRVNFKNSLQRIGMPLFRIMLGKRAGKVLQAIESSIPEYQSEELSKN